MNDLVFNCPSCHKALKIEDEAAGTRIVCPLCEVNVQVPRLRFAVVKGKNGGVAARISRQLKEIKHLELHTKSLSRDLNSIQRRLVGQEEEMQTLEQSAKLVLGRLELTSGQLAGRAVSPQEEGRMLLPPEPAEKGGGPKVNWGKLALIFGGLALFLAILGVCY